MLYTIIQARMQSTRLPGKVLKNLNGKPVLQHIVDRVKLAHTVSDNVIVATGSNNANNPIHDWCSKNGTRCFQGDENDVLSRFFFCAKSVNATSIVRITADCPFIDPNLIDKVVDLYYDTGAEYCSNIHPPIYPDGLDIEVFSFDTLQKAYENAKLSTEREHVTPYIWKRHGMFLCSNYQNKQHLLSNFGVDDLSGYRIVLDCEEDLRLMEKLSEMIKTTDFEEIVSILRSDESLEKINKIHTRNSSYITQLRKDDDIYTSSQQHYYRASKCIPGASQTYSKSYRYHPVGFAPNFITKAQGAIFTDVDGNQFVDYCCGLGAITLGYRYADVDDEVIAQIKNFGTSFTLPHVLEAKLAEKLCSIIPSAEMVKVLKNGSDATTAAVRLARAYTGKPVIAVCGYHGFHDWYIASTANNAGIPSQVADLTKTFVYNDIESLKKVFATNSVAAVVLEPCQGAGPKNNFLKEVRDLCTAENALLVFDEVVSGFRIALAGAQELYGVNPDLSAFGKGMGNGYAISVLVGRRNVMELIDKGGVFISTTFGGDCVSIAAALATIRVMETRDSIRKCIRDGNVWKTNADKMISNQLSSCIEMYGISPHCGFIFKDFNGVKSTEYASVYQQSLYESGVVSLGVNNFCFSHTDKQILSFVNATKTALDAVETALNRGSVEGMLKGEIRPIFRRNN